MMRGTLRLLLPFGIKKDLSKRECVDMSSFAVRRPPMMLEDYEGARGTLDNGFENMRAFEIVWVIPHRWTALTVDMP